MDIIQATGVSNKWVNFWKNDFSPLDVEGFLYL